MSRRSLWTCRCTHARCREALRPCLDLAGMPLQCMWPSTQHTSTFSDSAQQPGTGGGDGWRATRSATRVKGCWSLDSHLPALNYPLAWTVLWESLLPRTFPPPSAQTITARKVSRKGDLAHVRGIIAERLDGAFEAPQTLPVVRLLLAAPRCRHRASRHLVWPGSSSAVERISGIWHT